ncbi:MAG: HNH endonuclease [Treponema sp.]|jgi:hypothetical protein|nr:HNH endonuclease [Treponema sp.]
MEIKHETAMKLWKEKYGKGTEKANDREGRLMLKTAYGDESSKYGWNIHHRKAISNGGTSAKMNLEIVHILTHKEINRATI